MTAAQQQARLLRALATHLDRHPHLHPVIAGPIGYDGTARMQIAAALGHDLHAITGWARSLRADRATVRTYPDADPQHHLHIDGVLAGIPVEVWSGVAELNGADLASGSWVRVEDLPGLAARAAGDQARVQAVRVHEDGA